jgi:hypothetical protein
MLGNCSATAPGVALDRLFPTRFYRLHPWRRTSCIHAVVLRSAASLPFFTRLPADLFGFIVGAPSGAMLLDVISDPVVLEHAPSSRGIHADVSLASRRASHFSLRGQREVTKRKATPKRWSTGILPCDCATGRRGFADSTSLCWQQTGRDPSRPPCGPFLRPVATAYGTLVARIVRANATARAEASGNARCRVFIAVYRGQ